MVDALLGPEFEDSGVMANDLLAEFGKGFPLQNLRPLLVSNQPRAQAAGAFIATFLGFRLNGLAPELAGLLGASDPRTRSDAVEALRYCTTPINGDSLGRVLLLLDDSHPGVRWKVVQFICGADPWQLRIGLKNAAEMRPQLPFTLLSRVYGQHFRATAGLLKQLLAHEEPLVRRFGAAVAVRPRYVIDENFVEMAMQSDDSEVERIARDGREGFLAPKYAVSSSSL